MNNRIIRTARRISRLAGFESNPYIMYGAGQCIRGPFLSSAAGRLAAARAFHRAPSPNGAILYAGEIEIARC